MEHKENIDWDGKFDAIYCIHYLPFTNRVERISSELKRVGILDSKNFRWKYTFDSPFYANLINSNISLFHSTLRNPSMLKCTLSHYEIYKEADGLGFERILVIEDDVVFLKDLKYIGDSIRTMPDGFDIVQFDYWPFSRAEYDYYLSNTRINDRYAEFKNRMSSGAMYSATTKALKFMIRRQESALHAGDTAWHAEEPNDGLRRCFSIKNLGYQKQYEDSYSSGEHGRGTLNLLYRNCDLRTEEYA